MSLEPRTFYPGRILPLPSLNENPLLPSLATMVMCPLTTPRFRSQAPEVFLSSISGLPQPPSNLGSQRQQTRAHLPDKSHPSGVLNPRLKPPTQPPSTACQPKPSVDGFEFIQINKPSGKTDSAGGASMRSHIMKKFHENRRQRGKARVCLSVLPASHRCSTAKSSITSVQSFEVAANRHRLSSVSGQPFRPTIRGQSFNMPSKEVPPQTINVAAVCVQCGKLILQQTPDNAWTLYGRSSRVPLSMLGSDAHDPFDSLAIPISHNMHGLIHHCKLSYQIDSSHWLTEHFSYPFRHSSNQSSNLPGRRSPGPCEPRSDCFSTIRCCVCARSSCRRCLSQVNVQIKCGVSIRLEEERRSKAGPR
jgi:hypothetical protein